jgi:hypothetical protein
MPSLDADFDLLAQRLAEPASLAAARTDPFYYFVYPPEDALEVKRRIPVWSARLRHADLQVERVSFSDLIWELIDASGRWDAWLEAEADADQVQVNEAIRNVLRTGNALVERVASVVGQERPRTVVFLTETEMLHPYFRVRTLESALHDRIKIPTVVFYPGRRAGQFGLNFLGFYPEDGNYRATIIGGLP